MTGPEVLRLPRSRAELDAVAARCHAMVTRRALVSAGLPHALTVCSPSRHCSQNHSAMASTSSLLRPRHDWWNAPWQGPSDVASGAGGFLVGYRSATATSARHLVQRLDAAGNPLSAEPTVVATGDPLTLRGGPAVAWNGSVFLYAWSTQDTVYARRLAADGSPLDAAPIAVMTTAFGPPDVEALGSDYLVVGYRCGITCQYINPIARRVRGSDGSLPDPSPIGISREKPSRLNSYCMHTGQANHLSAIGERSPGSSVTICFLLISSLDQELAGSGRR